jgi:hypothetical protein
MRTRLIFFLIILLALAGVYLWRSPYHQVRSVVTVVDINAPGNRVWQTLTDLEGYRDWNPFLTSASGTLTPGGTITITAKIGTRSLTFHPQITAVEPRKKLVWVGRLFSSTLFEGEHTFDLIELDQAHTRVMHSERFRGMLVGLLWNRFSPPLIVGFRAMNEVLKRRCEQAVTAPL